MTELAHLGYESTEVSAREVIGILRRRWGTLLVTLLLFVAAAAILTARMTPIYEARATMLVEQSPLRNSTGGEQGPIGSLMVPAEPHSLDTQVEVLHSGPLLGKVIERLGSFPGKAFPSLSAAQVRDTDVLQIVAESTDPRVAQDAANLLVDEYIRQTRTDRLLTTVDTRQFVQHKLEEAQRQLLEADARLRDFKRQHDLTDLNSNLSNAIVTANSIGEELRKNENELMSLRTQIRQIQAVIGSEPVQVQGDYTIGPNPRVSSLQSDIEQLEMRRISLIRVLRPTEPEVREVDAQIARLKQRQRKLPLTVRNGVTWQPNPQRLALQGQLNALMTQARGLEPLVVRLRVQNQQARERLRTFPGWETTLAQLQRERDRTEENQKELNKQLRDLRLREQAEGVLARPLTHAGRPGSPVRPRRTLNLLVGAALGLVFGVGLACLRDTTDARLHTTEEAERLVGLPILGRVPVFPGRPPALISAAGDSPMKESFRRLRARITFAAEPVRSLMLTSATAGEGKSTTAANLAVAAALQGRRVILVDADLRDPSLASLFRTGAEPGLSDLLVDSASLTETLHPTGIQDLLLLPAGSQVANSAELLAGPRLDTLVQEMTGMADLVIFDTPPCLPVADAEVLGSRVDATVLVVGLGHTNREAVRLARELLDQAHVHLLGVVLNRIKPGDRDYYYRYQARSTATDAIQRATAMLPRPSVPPASGGFQQEDRDI